MLLKYDVSINNGIDLKMLNSCTSDALRYAEHNNYDIVGTKIIQSTSEYNTQNGYSVSYRLEVSLKERC